MAKHRRILTDSIVNQFRNDPKKAFNYKQLSGAVGIRSSEDRMLVSEILNELRNNDFLEEVSRGKFRLNAKNDILIEGRIDFTRNGSAYLITDDGQDDIYIPAGKTLDALQDDRVLASIRTIRRRNPEAVVVEVLQRGMEHYVGIIHVKKTFAFVLPTNKKIHTDFFVPGEHIKGAEDGQKVIVDLLDWPRDADNPFAKVVEILGNPGDNETEMHAILAEFGLPLHFPEKVEALAEDIPLKISKKEVSSRRDFRSVTTFTIDPEDAKDFDDALSFQTLEDGWHEVGIHIADVSHYVKPGDTIDKEAIKRATSVYLVDRVVPMLPETLSNVVCSLRPDEDKLCFSAVFEMNEKGALRKEWFGRTVIRSKRRFTYDQAQEILEGKPGDFEDELKWLNNTAKTLRAERIKSGAIEFGGSEVKFKLDKNGKPISVYEKVMKDANRLIEEFMLLANKRVAMRVGDTDELKKKAFVYRIHDLPDPEKLKTLRDFVARLGYKMASSSSEGASYAINKLLKEVEGKPEEDVIKQMSIRAMAKAVYSTQNVGHYGLAFDFYTHFTSPIRRYPDVMVHRLLARYLDGGASVNSKDLELKCKHSSLMEKRATDAERASIKYKQVEFMLDKIGQQFIGVISGLTRWGIFVEIKDNRCEGMVALASLKDDNYYFDESKYRIVGMRYKEVYNFGDTVKVEVKGADLEQKQLDLELLGQA